MLYKFKSKEAGDVIMLEGNGRQILEIIGKDPGPRGIILPEQMPAALAAIDAAIAQEKANAQEAGAAHPEGVSLQQRALPFIQMLQVNHKAGQDVVWGV